MYTVLLTVIPIAVQGRLRSNGAASQYSCGSESSHAARYPVHTPYCLHPPLHTLYNTAGSGAQSRAPLASAFGGRLPSRCQGSWVWWLPCGVSLSASNTQVCSARRGCLSCSFSSVSVGLHHYLCTWVYVLRLRSRFVASSTKLKRLHFAQHFCPEFDESLFIYVAILA